ncbi:MAG: hypothetical protein P1P71_09650 [Anaerosomatales bacterium]|nr:hypothetical protein [Anaerosomatales bacterium]
MGCVLFDWGDMLMIDYPEYSGPMRTWPHVEAEAHTLRCCGRRVPPVLVRMF